MVLLDGAVSCKDVVFVIESSVALRGHYETLLKDYIIPIIQHFFGLPQLQDPGTEFQHGTTQYCVLEVNPLGLYYMETVTYQPVTSQVGQIIQDVKGLRMVGGPCCPTWPLTEGLAAALEVFDEMDRLRATSYVGQVSRHCIVIGMRPGEQTAVKLSKQYLGLSLDALAVKFSEHSISLSVICPRKFAVYQDLFEKFKGKDPSSIDEMIHETDPLHLVLLQGFQLPSSHSKELDTRPLPSIPEASINSPLSVPPVGTPSKKSPYNQPSCEESKNSPYGMEPKPSPFTPPSVSGPPSVSQPLSISQPPSVSQSLSISQPPSVSQPPSNSPRINLPDATVATPPLATSVSSSYPTPSPRMGMSVGAPSPAPNVTMTMGNTPPTTQFVPLSQSGSIGGPPVLAPAVSTGVVPSSAYGMPGLQRFNAQSSAGISQGSYQNAPLTSSGSQFTSVTSSMHDSSNVSSSFPNVPNASLPNSSSGYPSASTGLTKFATGMQNTSMSSGMSTNSPNVSVGMNNMSTRPPNMTAGFPTVSGPPNVTATPSSQSGLQGMGGISQGPPPMMGPGPPNVTQGHPNATAISDETMSMSQNVDTKPIMMPQPGSMAGSMQSRNQMIQGGPTVSSGAGGFGGHGGPGGPLQQSLSQSHLSDYSQNLQRPQMPQQIKEEQRLAQQQTVWTGVITVKEMEGVKHIQCKALAKPSVAPIIQADLWPREFYLVHYPKDLLDHLKEHCALSATTACTVTFQFTEPVNYVVAVKAITSTNPKHFGILTLANPGPQCRTKAMILLWTERQFCGVIPNDQESFMRAVSQVKERYANLGKELSGGALPPSVSRGMPSNQAGTSYQPQGGGANMPNPQIMSQNQGVGNVVQRPPGGMPSSAGPQPPDPMGAQAQDVPQQPIPGIPPGNMAPSMGGGGQTIGPPGPGPQEQPGLKIRDILLAFPQDKQERIIQMIQNAKTPEEKLQVKSQLINLYGQMKGSRPPLPGQGPGPGVPLQQHGGGGGGMPSRYGGGGLGPGQAPGNMAPRQMPGGMGQLPQSVGMQPSGGPAHMQHPAHMNQPAPQHLPRAAGLGQMPPQGGHRPHGPGSGYPGYPM